MDRLLDVNKRLGLDDGELDDFERKTSEIAKLVAGLKDGSLDPKNVKVPGEKTPEELREEAAAKERAEKDRIAREQAATAKERSDWWSRAEALKNTTRAEFFQKRRQQVLELVERGEEQAKQRSSKNSTLEEKILITDDDGVVLFPKPKKKTDALDYSKWDSWIPDDPISLSEMQAKKDAIEAERNAAFESANPEFCSQFRDDQAKREESLDKKRREAEKLRNKGNAFFKRGQLSEALASYRQALKVTPLCLQVLCNIAAVCIKENRATEALEFSERAVFLDSEHPKALWRRAKALAAVNRLEECCNDLFVASLVDSENADIRKELQAVRSELMERKAEQAVLEAPCPPKEQHTETLNRLTKLLAQGDAPVSLAQAEELRLAHRMCEELAKLVPGKKELGVPVMLAAQGLTNMLQDPACPEESKVELSVLARTSGAFDRICEWFSERHKHRSVESNQSESERCEGGKVSTTVRLLADTIAMCTARSARNTSRLQDLKVVENALQGCSAIGSDFVLLCALASGNSSFRTKLATRGEVFLACEAALAQPLEKKYDDALVPQLLAAEFVMEVCSSNESRDLAVKCMKEALRGHGQGIVRSLQRLVLAGGWPRVREDAAAALANLVHEESLRSLVDSGPLAAALGEAAFCQERTAAMQASFLAILLNLTMGAESPCRVEITQRPSAVDALVKLGLGSSDEAVQVRAAALLSRLCASGTAEWIRGLLSRNTGLLSRATTVLGTRGAPCSQALSEHMVRIIAALVRDSESSSSFVVEPLSLLLEERALMAASGASKVITKGTDHTTANVAQCFVSLTEQAAVCGMPCVRYRVIPALIKLIQFTQDGPIRKNAAICVAKLAKSGPENMQAIRDLRGMEMLLEIGGRLTK